MKIRWLRLSLLVGMTLIAPSVFAADKSLPYTLLRNNGPSPQIFAQVTADPTVSWVNGSDTPGRVDSLQEGLVQFKKRVIDLLVKELSENEVLSPEDLSTPFDAGPNVDPRAVADVILNSDLADWSGSVVAVNDASDNSDVPDVFSYPDLMANVGGEEGPAHFASASGDAPYGYSHLADSGGSTISGNHTELPDTSDIDVEGNTYGPGKTHAATAKGTPAVAVPLPPALYSVLPFCCIGLAIYLRRQHNPSHRSVA